MKLDHDILDPHIAIVDVERYTVRLFTNQLGPLTPPYHVTFAQRANTRVSVLWIQCLSLGLYLEF